MFGLQIRGSVSRSNSVIRTASGCTTISSSHIFRIKNYPNEHRISRSQNRFNSGIRSISHPTDLSTFIALKKATATTDHTRFTSSSKREEDYYEENEEVEEEGVRSRFEEEEVQRDKDEEQEIEETEPRYAVSFLPYFQKKKIDQFREKEDFDMEDLNKEAHSKYSRAVEEKDAVKTETIMYRLELARPKEDEEECTDAACTVRDLRKEEHLKREAQSYSHLQPCNIRPFGCNDSLFFPMKGIKGQYPIYRKFGENDPPIFSGSKGGSSQRDYSTISSRKQNAELKTQTKDAAKSKNERQRSAKEQQRPYSRKVSELRKEPKKEKHRNDHKLKVKATCAHEPPSKPTLQSIQARSQSQWQSLAKTKSVVPDLKPMEEIMPKKAAIPPESVVEKRVINNALNFARKYRDIYLTNDKAAGELGKEKQKLSKVQSKVNILLPKKTKVFLRQTSKLNLLQSSLPPEEAAVLDVKPCKNERMIPPWPSYSETVHRSSHPVSLIKFPNQVYTKKHPSKSEPLQAREFSTGLHQKRSSRRRLGNKNQLKWTFRLPHRRYSSLYDRPDCPKPRKAPMKDCRPLKQPKKKKIEQKQKCVDKKAASICSLRADSGLKVKRKKLPKIIPRSCSIQESTLKDCAPIVRLKKVRIPEPPKCTVKRQKICSVRADGNLIVKKKRLPILEPEECPKPQSKPMKDVKLARLKKVKIKQPPRVCVKKSKICPSRADAFLTIRKKQLPVLESDECLKLSPSPMKEAPRLSRFKKIDIQEPPKICKKDKYICPTRADKGLKVKSKSLPIIEPFECPKPASKPMKDCNSLKRLPKMKSFDPPKCKIVKKKVCSTTTRADSNLRVMSRRLPELVPHEGCKPKPSKMKDCKPIKRLKKIPIPKLKVCLHKAPECDRKRADRNLTIQKKQLPKLEASNCPALPPKPMKDVSLPRLKKVKVAEPPKICAKPKSECRQRADNIGKFKKKKLPELEVPDCPKVEEEPMKDIKLLRLKKVKIEEPKKVCPKKKEQCPERADVVTGYEIKKKPLKTVILSKKYNEISFRHFKKGKKKSKTPYFNTKRNYRVLTRSYSNRVYYHSRNKPSRKPVYRTKSLSATSKSCAPKKSVCPPKPSVPPKKSIWQRFCDYFRARPGCPSPDEWKKKRLREEAERAAKAAGMYLCECPRYQKKTVTIKKKPPCMPIKTTETCPKFKMPYCNKSELRSCEKEVEPIECGPPRETPYPSFSEWKREMTARKISECKVADKNAKAMKEKIKGLNKKNKNKKRARCFSTSSNSGSSASFYTQERAARIINALDSELKKTANDNNMVKKLFLVM